MNKLRISPTLIPPTANAIFAILLLLLINFIPYAHAATKTTKATKTKTSTSSTSTSKTQKNSKASKDTKDSKAKPKNITTNNYFTYKILGVNGKPLKNIQQRLNVEIRSITKPLNDSEAQLALEEGVEHIQQALIPYGYFKPSISSQLTQQQQTYTATYTIHPGPQLRITSIRFKIIGSGHNDPGFLRLRRKFLSKRGHVLTTEMYEDMKSHFFNKAQKRGYLDAKFSEHKILVNLPKYTANIILVFNTGPRYRFGWIKIKSKHFDHSFILRFAHIRPGEYYSTKKLAQFQRNLSTSGYFKYVSVTAHRELGKHHEVPLIVHVVARPARQYLIGIGYGTFTGPRATLGFNWNRVTRDGQKFQLLFQVTQIQDNYIARYTIPGADPVTRHYDIQLASQNLDINSVGSSRLQSLSFSDIYTPSDRFQRTFKLSYQYEESKLVRQPKTFTKFLIPSLTWKYVYAKNPVITRNGFRLSGAFLGAGKALASERDFFKSSLHTKAIVSLNDYNRFVFRGDIGAIAVHNISQMPLSLLFLTGGPETLRGFRLLQVGPGRFLKLVSLEYQVKVYGEFFIGFFGDAANAANNINVSLQRSVGIGIGYYSPIGPIELTFAKATTKPSEPLAIQFSIGPDL